MYMIFNRRWQSVVSLSVLLIGLSVQSASAVTCHSYDWQVNQAWFAEDIVQLERLLTTLKRVPDCSESYLEQLKRRLSSIAAANAKYWVQQGQLSEAEQWLNYRYVPINLWSTQAVRGDIAAKRKQWKEATFFYNQALDLIADSGATLQRPPHAEIERVYRLAVETQLLAGMLTTVRSTGQSAGTLRDDLGLVITERPIPMQFVFDSIDLTENGQDSADQLVKYLLREKPARIILIGHTDEWGSDRYNCSLSKDRAETIKNHLVAAGIAKERITTLGNGERKPLELYDPSNYSPAEIDQINRRVEFAIDTEVSYDKACL